MSKSSIKSFRYKVNLFLEKSASTYWEFVSYGTYGMYVPKEDIPHLSPEDQILYEMLKNINIKILFKSTEIRNKLDERLKVL